MKIFLKKISIFILFFILIFHGSSFAQQHGMRLQKPVKWSFSFVKTGENSYDLVLKAKIDRTWHVYSQFIPEGGPVPTSFTFNKTKDYQMVGKTIEKSKIIQEYDSNFEMMMKYFENEAVFIQKVRTNGKVNTISGTLEFMTCDNKQCLQPEEIDFSFKLNEGPPDTTTVKVEQKDTSQKNSVVTKTPEKPATPPEKKGLWAFILIAISQGLLSLVTPCVFPMIPMTVSFFTHSEKKKSKGIMNALVFGFSIIILFIIFGIIFGAIFGEDTSHELSTHWLPNIFFSFIFLVFAASFLGMFEITMPSWLINKFDKQADKGGFFGPIFMAFTTVLVSFSCTMPMVAIVIALAKDGDIFKSIIGMLAYSLAFATPFTLFAIFPKWLTSLPKSGGWLNAVKVFLGFIELALGLKFLSVADQAYHWNLLDREVYLAIWIVIFTLLGLYLLGKLRFSHDSDLPYIGVPRLILAIVVFSFVVYMIPGMFGAPLKGLSGYLPPQHTQDFDLYTMIKEKSGTTPDTTGGSELCEKPKYSDILHQPHGMKGYFDYEQALKCSRQINKPVFVDFTGQGCVSCREMEARVWSDPQVLKILKNEFIVVSLYVDDKTPLPENEWVKSPYDGKMKKSIGKKNADIEVSKYSFNAQPYYILIDGNETRLAEPRAYNLDVAAYVSWLEEGLAKYRELHGNNVK